MHLRHLTPRIPSPLRSKMRLPTPTTPVRDCAVTSLLLRQATTISGSQRITSRNFGCRTTTNPRTKFAAPMSPHPARPRVFGTVRRTKNRPGSHSSAVRNITSKFSTTTAPAGRKMFPSLGISIPPATPPFLLPTAAAPLPPQSAAWCPPMCFGRGTTHRHSRASVPFTARIYSR